MKDLWINLLPEPKEQIKRNALKTLASPFKSAWKGAAQAVSAIASIEIPRGEWLDIITILTENANGEVPEYKLASLESLGYIFEELREGSLTPTQVNLSLSVLIINLMPHIQLDELKLSSLSTLTNCIKFCEPNFKTITERNTIISNVLACCSVPNQDIRMKGMQCILEIVRCFYDYIDSKLLEIIANTTFNCIRNDKVEEVALAALEIWCSICDEEIERLEERNKPCMNYIRTIHESLIKLLLECLSREYSSDDNDWNISTASAWCISLIATILKDLIVPFIVKYASTNISSPNWHLRNAALLSFASILKGIQKHTIDELVTSVFGTLLNSLQDPNSHVRETTAWCFANILETSPESVLEAEVLNKLLLPLVMSLKDAPKVSNQVCYALYNLANAGKPYPTDNTGPLSMYFKDILNALWQNAFRTDGFEDGVNLANSSMMTFTNIIQNSAPDVELNINQVLQLLLEEFAASLQPSYRVAAKAAEYQGYLCSAMQGCFMKLTGKIDSTLSENVMQLIIESFKFRKNVYDEAVLAISTFISAIGAKFKAYMDQFGPYLIYALKNIEDTTLCRVAASCVGEIARALEEEAACYLPEIIPILMEDLRNAETERGTKLVIIIALSDLAMATNKFFLPYLKDVLEILKSACELSLNPPDDDDPELPSYLQNLKESLIEAYSGIFYCLKEAQDTSVMDPCIAELFKYIQSVYKEDIDKEFLRSMVGLIGDIANLYEGRVKHLLQQTFVQRMIAQLDCIHDKESKSLTSWAKATVAMAVK